MSKSSNLKKEIQKLIQEMMDRVMVRVLEEDPFQKDKHRADKPLYAALVPDEIFKGSHFERRFVTPFGKIWEKLAVVAANEGLGYGALDYQITGKINEERLNRISSVLNNLEHPSKGKKERVKPNWDAEIKYILDGKSSVMIPVTIVCDVYAEDKRRKRKYSFKLKAPLPNSDQTKVSKEKIFKLHSMQPPKINAAYFALPYNPYGRKEDYDWGFPNRWFDMKMDNAVLIGDEFWDKIGGKGTYKKFIQAVNEIGPIYRRRIYKEFLGIEPPESDKWKLS